MTQVRIQVRQERHSDHDAREALLDRAYGDVRFTKTSERLRADRLPAAGLSFVATDKGGVIGTVRLWNVSAGADRPALLLGPLAVSPEHQGQGVGAKLMKQAIAAARMRGHRAILLVGNAPYYSRFGFSAEKTAELEMPGSFQKDRLLALELDAGALDGARGMIGATGRPAQKRDRVAPAAAASSRAAKNPTPRAA
jgi:predicted N-acetyltransferase YhbS